MAALSPPSSRAVASWFTGWINVGGQIVLTASAAFAAGLQLQALIILNDESYVPQRWQGLLFYWLILFYAAAINIWGSKMLPTANLLSGKQPVASTTYSTLTRNRCPSHHRLPRYSHHTRCYGAQELSFLRLHRSIELEWLVQRRYFLACWSPILRIPTARIRRRMPSC